MWNCRKCNAEVDDGFEVCWSCGTGIDGREDPDFAGGDEAAADASAPAIATAEALVTIASPALPEHAHVLRCHLEAAGIGVFIADEPVSGFDWLLHRGPEPIHLQVRETDADRAKAILAEIPTEEKAPPAEEKVAEPVPPPAPLVWEPANKASIDPQEYIRALESKLSSVMDEHDTPDWKVNPAFHPDVNAFIQAHANNAAFLKKAQAMQQNRAKYFATMRKQAKEAAAAREAETDAQTAEVPNDVPMCEEVTPEAPKPRLRLRVPRFFIRLAKWTAILLVLLVIGVYLTATTYRQMGENELKKAIARIEETDPDWRWDDLQAKRAQVSDGENAALKVMAVARMLPEKDAERDAPAKEIYDLEPNVPLDEMQCERLREMLGKYESALREARKLAGLSTGRFPAVSERGLPISPSYPQSLAAVRALLFLEMTLLVKRGTIADASLTSLRGILATGRSVGDEPGLLPWLCRRACRKQARLGIQRVLAQQLASEAALGDIQKFLEEESARPVMLNAVKGERAWAEEVYTRIEAGNTADLGEFDTFFQPTYWGGIQRWLAMGWIKQAHASGLEMLTEAVDVAKLPVEQQTDAWDGLEAKCKAKKVEEQLQMREVLGTMHLTAVIVGARAFLHDETGMRCTIAALAAERYRLANEKWPETLDALVPKYLPKVPVDPYDGKPLRMRRLDDGLVIYSIGPDREDNQGTLERKGSDLKGKDIGFRLWDVERRRARSASK